MVIFRTAKNDEADAIAQLHTESWRVAYRSILSENYIKTQLLDDRLAAWRQRFLDPSVNQHIIVAEEVGEIVGFVCIFGNDDPIWGALIDNLHVLPTKKGQGMGKQLMAQAADWIARNSTAPKYYLWVYESNRDARAFYEKLGGQNVETTLYKNPDGNESPIVRYAFES